MNLIFQNEINELRSLEEEEQMAGAVRMASLREHG